MKDRTIKEQMQTQNMIEEKFQDLLDQLQSGELQQTDIILYKDEHVQYLLNSIENVGKMGSGNDSGHPWLVYWIINSLYMLKPEVIEKNTQLKQKLVKFLSFCQYKSGGFTGGHGQYPQLASTYSAILSLLIIGTDEAYNTIDREGIYNFLISIKNPDGSFRMSAKGETDLRGSYIAVILSDILNIKTEQLIDEQVTDYIALCQTYEGGLGPIPFSEAHGGLTFCGLAALCQLKHLHKIDSSRLIGWLQNRQMKVEKGFQGRTNKLVDNCYSFWQGASFRLLADYTNYKASYNNRLLMNQIALQSYILLNQDEEGGLMDKPGKPRDLYHTCYSLAGLSIAQTSADRTNRILMFNNEYNAINDVDPIYNIPVQKLQLAKQFFQNTNKNQQNQKQQ